MTVSPTTSPKLIAEADIINSASPLEHELLGVHPRIYARQEDFDRIRARLNDPLYADAWASSLTSAKEFAAFTPEKLLAPGDARSRYSSIPNMVFAWKMTDDTRFRDAAILFIDTLLEKATSQRTNSLTGGHFSHGVAVSIDWLWHDVDTERRERWLDQLATVTLHDFEKWNSENAGVAQWYTCNHFSVGLSGLLACGCTLYGERPDMAQIINLAMEKARLASIALGKSGMSPEGIGYGLYYTTYMVKIMQMLSELVGPNLFEESPWWHNHALAMMHHMLPRNQWTPSTSFMQWGDNQDCHWYGPDVSLRPCAKWCGDAKARWLSDACDKAKINLSSYEKCFPMFLMDENLPSEGPENLPTMHHFEDFGLIMARSDWSGDETVGGFLCGPSYGAHAMKMFHQPVGGGHMHAFAGHFQIFSHGEFIFPPAWYTCKMTNYHNVVMVNGAGQFGESESGWFEDLPFRQGHPTPHMLSVTDEGGAVHAVGDATNGYVKEAGVKQHIRHFLYVRPECWVIVDFLSTEKPSTFELYFHPGFDMQEDENGAFVGQGKQAGLRVRSLMGEGAFRCIQQDILDSAFQPKWSKPCLVFENSTPIADAVYVTVLESSKAGEGFSADVTCTRDGADVIVTVNGTAYRMKAAQ